MTRLSREPLNCSLTDDQIDCLLDFAAQVVGSRSALSGVQYRIIGIEDLSNKEAAAALLNSLHKQDWVSAGRHAELAGLNNLLVAILLHIAAEELAPHDYWVAMRSPFEYLDSASLITWGTVNEPPALSMRELPLERVRGRKG